MPQGTLANLSRGRDNNLTLLRFLAASLVIFSHAFGITHHGDWEPLYQLCGLSLGSWAVDVFFVISGFLITKSWYRRQNVVEYLYARFMRIYPALWVAVGLCVFVVGPAFTSLPLRDYFTHIDTLKFLLENTTLLIKGVFTTLPGVFETHPSDSVNSPLWTLPYELKMYLLLGACSLFGLTPRRFFLPLLISAAFAVFVIASLRLDADLIRHESMARFIFFFFAGALFYVYRARILIRRAYLIAVLIVLVGVFCLPITHELKRLSLALATPYLIIALAFGPAGVIRQFNRAGDYSYGLYIYGLPIQQVVLAMTGLEHALFNFAVSWVLCLALAAASWHYLEERALKLAMPGWLARLSQSRYLQLRRTETERS